MNTDVLSLIFKRHSGEAIAALRLDMASWAERGEIWRWRMLVPMAESIARLVVESPAVSFYREVLAANAIFTFVAHCRPLEEGV